MKDKHNVDLVCRSSHYAFRELFKVSDENILRHDLIEYIEDIEITNEIQLYSIFNNHRRNKCFYYLLINKLDILFLDHQILSIFLLDKRLIMSCVRNDNFNFRFMNDLLLKSCICNSYSMIVELLFERYDFKDLDDEVIKIFIRTRRRNILKKIFRKYERYRKCILEVVIERDKLFHSFLNEGLKDDEIKYLFVKLNTKFLIQRFMMKFKDCYRLYDFMIDNFINSAIGEIMILKYDLNMDQRNRIVKRLITDNDKIIDMFEYDEESVKCFAMNNIRNENYESFLEKFKGSKFRSHMILKIFNTCSLDIGVMLKYTEIKNEHIVAYILNKKSEWKNYDKLFRNLKEMFTIETLRIILRYCDVLFFKVSIVVEHMYDKKLIEELIRLRRLDVIRILNENIKFKSLMKIDFYPI